MIRAALISLCFFWANLAFSENALLTVGGPSKAEQNVFAFGGGVWRVPKVMRIAEPTLAQLGEGGTYRAALAWEVLAKLNRAEETSALLADYPLNDFLAERSRKGGTIIITLDATPLFLAASKSSKALPDGPAWAKAPIASETQWSEIVRRTVSHFNTLGINPIIEVWNEPDHALKGAFSDYIRLYRATAIGAKNANPRTRLAGPSLSDWTATLPDGTRWAEAFFAAAAKTPAGNMRRLPIDVITYHSFNRIPARHHARVVKDIAKLAKRFGYKMPLVINSEWNINAEPPYPEGDLNGEFPGAAHIGASLIAMAKAGAKGQSFQMMVDPGAKGYSAGVLSVGGTPRAAFHAFDLANALTKGQLREVQSSSEIVTAMASKQGRRISVLVASFPPTDLMLIRDAMEPLALSAPALFQSLTQLQTSRVVSYFKRGGTPPGNSAQRKALQEGRARYKEIFIARESWRAGGTFELTLPEPYHLTRHRVIDRTTAPKGKSVRAQDAQTNQQLRKALTKVGRDLQNLDPADPAIQDYASELQTRVDGRQALDRHGARLQNKISLIDQNWSVPATQRLQSIAAAQARKLTRNIPPKTSGQRFIFETEPYALHLLEFEK